jgi:acyl-CoA synthetase (NDP forming)
VNPNKLVELKPVFYPESVAVVGASEDQRKVGSSYLRCLLDGGFKGRLYAVGAKEGTIWSLPIYRNLKAIPEPIDYVIVAIPKQFILDLLDDCAAKEVKVVQIFTAGFSESGSEEGRRLEVELARKARNLGIRIIGPNCIGVYCPESGMHLPRPMLRQEGTGSVAFVCQSGGHTANLAEAGLARRIKFSKVVSFGNGCDLDSIDFLEYFAVDPETRIVGVYLEGVKDGPRLVKVITEISKNKPVIVWKGGITEAGAQTAISHTASIATSDAVWRAALKQGGAIKVQSLDELTDTILAFQFLPRLEGNRVAIIAGIGGGGGGACVAGCDACLSQGLEVPPLTEETRARLKSIIPPDGSILRNPVDVGAIALFRGLKYLPKPMELTIEDPGVDMAIIDTPLSQLIGSLSEQGFDAVLDTFIALRKAQYKPLIVVSPPLLREAEGAAMRRKLAQAQIPVYPTFDRAAKAIANVIQYWKFRAEIDEEAA